MVSFWRIRLMKTEILALFFFVFSTKGKDAVKMHRCASMAGFHPFNQVPETIPPITFLSESDLWHAVFR